MKKISAILITMAMLFTLNGCSGDKGNSSENSVSNETVVDF